MRQFFLILLLLPLLCHSQGNGILPLKTILGQIETQHHVRFSYIDEELVVYQLPAPDASLPLQAKLDYLQSHTRLHFEAVTKEYYTIYNDRKMDKPLCGFLIDKDTGKGIENAAVSIASLGITTASDANGYFELPVLAPNDISIRHMGYEPKKLSPQELYVSGCPQVKMVSLTYKLSEVAPQRYLTTGISKNPNGTISVRPSKFAILPGLTEPDVLQTMQQVPGIMSVDETVSNINVRGGTHDQNLFLWNGIRMFQTGHFFGLISAFNPMLATRISIAKNGSSAFSGESVSAVVDLSSHTKTLDSCYNAIAADMINANFLAKVKLSSKATIQAAGRRTYTDVIRTPTFKAYEKRVFENNTVNGQTYSTAVASNTDFYFYDFSLQYHQKIGSRHELILDAIGLQNEADFKQQLATSQNDSYLSQKSYGGILNWKSRWNDRQESTAQVYYSWYQLDSKNQAVASNLLTQQQNQVADNGFRLRHALLLSSRLELDAGYQFNQTVIENDDTANSPAFFRHSSEISNSHAIVLESVYKSTDEKTQLQLGVRGNYFERFALFRLEPRLSLSRALSQRWILEVLGEFKNQTLSQVIDRQQDFLGIEKRRWALANENDLPVQKSRQLSFGFTYSGYGWLFTCDHFYKKVSGISSQSQGFQNQYEQMHATGDYRVFGAEALLQKSFSRFYTWVSYSYTDNRYDFGSFSPREFPNNTAITHALSWAGIYDWQQLRLALGARWHTGRNYTAPLGIAPDSVDPAASRIVYANANSGQLGDYFQVNFSASRGWHIGKSLLTASLSLLNLLDKKNEVNRYYRINANTIETVNNYAFGFTPNVGVRLTF